MADEGHNKMSSSKINDLEEPIIKSKACHSIWNPYKREFFNRTWDSWAKIAIFYVFFYSGLAAFFAALLFGFFQTLDSKKPTQTNLQSLLKANPGMAFRPRISLESTLIKFEQGVPKSYQPYVDDIEDYLKGYYNQSGVNVVDCDENTDGEALANEGKVCRVGRSMFGEECSRESTYSYHEGSPCVLLKVNRIFNWNPINFNKTDYESSNDTITKMAKSKLKGRWDPNYLGVSCEGENEADVDFIGKMKFFPEKGFPLYFYPYINQDNYKPPIVFVKFENPKPGVLIQVWCRVWASNVKHHKNDKAGSIHFELLID